MEREPFAGRSVSQLVVRLAAVLLICATALAGEVEVEVRRLGSADPRERRRAVRALIDATGYGPHCFRPIPKEDVESWEDAGRELRRVGKRAVPQLVELLLGQNADDAVVLLGVIGAEAVPHVVPLLKHKKPHVRQLAAWTLSQIGEEARPAAPALIAALQDPDHVVRHAAACALDATKARSEQVVGAFRAALKNEFPIVRVDAAAALLARGHRREAQAVFWAAKDELARGQMLLYLPRLFATDGRTIPTLIKALGEADFVAGCAELALRELGPRVRPQLTRALKTAKEPIAKRLRQLLEDC